VFKVGFIVVFVLCSPVSCFSSGRQSSVRSCFSRAFRPCFAKPPPTSSFDLDAIEAFEQQLDTVFDDGSAGYVSDPEDEGDIEVLAEAKMYAVPAELHNKRIDAVISSFETKLSRSHCGNLVTDGHVRIVENDGSTLVVDKKSFKVETGMILRVTYVSEEIPTEIVAQDIPLDILFEDEHMIVINKSGDMVVHPAAGNWDGTVVNALAYYLANKSPYGSGDFVGVDGSVNLDEAEGTAVDGTDGEAVTFRPGIVHRLDKGTTGVLVVAKTKFALASLSQAFASRTVTKTYLAVTVGNPGKRVVIDKPIGRHPVHRQRMRVVPDPHTKNSSGMAPKDRLIGRKSPSQAGRRALSLVDTLAFDGKLSVVQVRIETGRTHQIRVHLQDRHTPIYGDDVYGLSDWNKRLAKTHRIERPLLHAHRLEVDHPVTGERMTFLAPLGDDMMEVSKAIWPDVETARPEFFRTQ
jgi:23S rRNA pseudouridine1911/1915/1917 synthase